ncbi:MAG: O-antigen ligase family protein [Candidatus Andersenbacteria bacterium]|nr:O-antigen ligase family protein [Candidatus Andersenbacteria bacterium]
MEFVLLTVFLVALFLVALVRPYWGVLLVLFLLPSYEWRFEMLGLPTTFLECSILLVVLAWLLRTHWNRYAGVGGVSERLRRLGGQLLGAHLLWPSVLFVLASVLAVVVAPDAIRAFGLWRAFVLEPLLLMLVLLDVVERKDQWMGVVWSLGLAALAVSLGAVLQVATGIGLLEGYDGMGGSVLRATSFFTYPAAVGLFLTPIALLFLGLLLAPREALISTPYRASAWFIVLFSVLGVVLAQTDGAIVGIALGTTVLACWRWGWWKPLVAVGFVGLVLLAVPAFRGRAIPAVTFQDTSGQVRLALWEGSLYLLADRPVLGSGLGGFTQLYGDYKLAQHTESTINYPHSLLLNFWAELTVFGAISVLWLLVAFTRLVQTNLPPSSLSGRSLQDHVSQNVKRDSRLGVLAIVLLGVVVYGIVDVPFFKNDLAVLWWIPFVLAVLATTNSDSLKEM